MQDRLEPRLAALSPNSSSKSRRRARRCARVSHPCALAARRLQARSGAGELGAEASLLRIEALAASGRRDEAARLARKFAVDHPNSPLIDRALAFVREAH